jgi:hypothetical protein
MEEPVQKESETLRIASSFYRVDYSFIMSSSRGLFGT